VCCWERIRIFGGEVREGDSYRKSKCCFFFQTHTQTKKKNKMREPTKLRKGEEIKKKGGNSG